MAGRFWVGFPLLADFRRDGFFVRPIFARADFLSHMGRWQGI